MYEKLRLSMMLSKLSNVDINSLNNRLSYYDIDIEITIMRFFNGRDIIKIYENRNRMVSLSTSRNGILLINYNFPTLNIDVKPIDIQNYTDEELMFIYGRKLLDENLGEYNYLSIDKVIELNELIQKYL